MLFFFLFFCSPVRDTGDSEKKRKRASEDKTQSGEEEKRKKREDSKGKDVEVKEPEVKKKKLSKDDSSSGSDDDEASLHSTPMHSQLVFLSGDSWPSCLTQRCPIDVFMRLIWIFLWSQKDKGRKKLQNTEMDKDVRRRKADESRE